MVNTTYNSEIPEVNHFSVTVLLPVYAIDAAVPTICKQAGSEVAADLIFLYTTHYRYQKAVGLKMPACFSDKGISGGS